MSDSEALIRRIFDEVINAGNMGALDEQWRAAVPDVRCTVDNVVAVGDLVGWTVHTTGTHTGDQLGFPATGKAFETVSANIGRMRDGRAAEHWAEQGMFPMLVQLGLIPVPA
jgi:predicted ester cyclase